MFALQSWLPTMTTRTVTTCTHFRLLLLQLGWLILFRVMLAQSHVMGCFMSVVWSCPAVAGPIGPCRNCRHAQFIANGVALLRWQLHEKPWERFVEQQGSLPADDGPDSSLRQPLLGKPSGAYTR